MTDATFSLQIKEPKLAPILPQGTERNGQEQQPPVARRGPREAAGPCLEKGLPPTLRAPVRPQEPQARVKQDREVAGEDTRVQGSS